MVGRYIKGSYTRVRDSLSISWLGDSCQISFQQEIRVGRYILVSEPVLLHILNILYKKLMPY